MFAWLRRYLERCHCASDECDVCTGWRRIAMRRELWRRLRGERGKGANYGQRT